jgi:hypothetical protein
MWRSENRKKTIPTIRLGNAADIEFSHSIAKLFHSSNFSDVTLRVCCSGTRDRTELKVHRCILAARSDFFRSMFSSGFRERDQQVITLVVAEGSSLAGMKEAISFLYKGVAEVSEDNCMEILAASVSLQISKLKQLCVEYLKTHMTVDSVCTIIAASQRMGLTNLKVLAEHYFYQNTEAVMNSESTIGCLPKDVFLQMLQGDEFDVDEEVVFSGLLAWGEANKITFGHSEQNIHEGGISDMTLAVADFMPHIRFDAMSPVFLQEVVRKSGVVGERILNKCDTKAIEVIQPDQECVQEEGRSKAAASNKDTRTKRSNRSAEVVSALKRKRARTEAEEEQDLEQEEKPEKCGVGAVEGHRTKRRRRNARHDFYWTYTSQGNEISPDGLTVTHVEPKKFDRHSFESTCDSVAHGGRVMMAGVHYWEMSLHAPKKAEADEANEGESCEGRVKLYHYTPRNRPRVAIGVSRPRPPPMTIGRGLNQIPYSEHSRLSALVPTIIITTTITKCLILLATRSFQPLVVLFLFLSPVHFELQDGRRG